MTPRKQVDPQNALIVKRTAYTNTLNAIIAGGFCPFCEKHLFKHHARPVLFKNVSWLVTENAWPYTGAKHHFLFITRTHTEKTEDLTPTAWGDMHKLYLLLAKKYKFKGATLMMRSGDTRFTGASVNHLHAHLVVGSPRSKTTQMIKAPIAFKK
jgi:ATP adenylyltransferase